MNQTSRKILYPVIFSTIFLAASTVFAETTEIVTYYPTTGGGGSDPQVNSIRVGSGYAGSAVPANGEVLIQGNIQLPATTATAGVIFSGANTYLHSYGTNNFFAGATAGNLTMTRGQNTGIGFGALNANTTGFSNVAVGTGALRQNTTGVNNTAVGAVALNLNTNGSSNTAIGSGALNKNTTGGLNIAVGSSAMGANIDGSENIALGVSALGLNTSGSRNIAIGRETLINNLAADDNTADGYAALHDNTAGSQNTAMGGSALTSNSSGTGNTALGYNAGVTGTVANATTTGSNNTFIGYQSGPGTATQLDNASAIGANALVSASNALVLGGTGANAVSVGIGTETPSATLDVNSGAVRVSRNASNAAASAAPQNGMIYYNTTTNNYRAYQNGRWVELSPTRPSVYINAAASDLLVSTTYADDPELQLTVGAGERWQFEIVAVARVYVDTDLKFKLAGPGAGVLGDVGALATMFKTGNAAGGSGVSSSSYWTCLFGAYTDAQVVDFPSDGWVHIFITGDLHNSAATAGTFRIQWALRNPPGGNAAIWRARYLRATRTA